jgi:hypothetical protein
VPLHQQFDQFDQFDLKAVQRSELHDRARSIANRPREVGDGSLATQEVSGRATDPIVDTLTHTTTIAHGAHARSSSPSALNARSPAQERLGQGRAAAGKPRTGCTS